jgi:predicted Zn-ribbon and HTH transcriptional regulator
LQQADYYKCSGCGYEFLSRTPACPRCKSDKLEKLDLKKLVGFDG